jgi:hypothetical protein
MNPTPAEISEGQKALRLIEAYKKRRQRSVGAYIREALWASLFALGLRAMGTDWLGTMIIIPIWLAPRILTDYLVKRRLEKDLATIQDLHSKYGTAIDSELERTEKGPGTIKDTK